MTLSWTAVPDTISGSIRGYEYTANPDAASPDWTDIPDGSDADDRRANETSFTVTGLVNNRAYYFAVRAENGHGPGAATPTRGAVPVPAGAPQQPGGFRAEAQYEQVWLTWALPNHNHPVTAYQYRHSTDGGATWDPDWTAVAGSGAGTTEHTLTGLSNGTTYTLELRALNGAVAGPAARRQATPSQAAATKILTPEGSGVPGTTRERLGHFRAQFDTTTYTYTTPDGDTYTVIHIGPGGLAWRITVPGSTDIDGRTFTVRSLQGGTPETASGFAFTTTGQEGIDIVVQPPLGGPAQVCLEPSPLLRQEVAAEGRSLMVLHYDGTAWKALPVTHEDGLVCGTTSSFSGFVLGYSAPPVGGGGDGGDGVGGGGGSGTAVGQGPLPVRSIPAQVVAVGAVTETLDLAPYFDDPNGSRLTYAASSMNTRVVEAEVPAGSSRLVLRGVAAGEAAVVITVTDAQGGTVSHALRVTTNTPPTLVRPIPAQAVAAGGAVQPLELAPYFDDPNGNPLTYAAQSADSGVVLTDLPQGSSQLLLLGVAVGETVVVVTASNPGGVSVSARLRVTVTTEPAVVRAIPAQVVAVGAVSEALDLAPYFDDPGGGAMVYAAQSNDAAVVTAEVPHGSSGLVLRGVAAGETLVVVTASNPYGITVSHPLRVTTNDAPAAARSIPLQVAPVGGASAPLDLAPYFNDPNGDALRYAAVSDDPGVVTAAVAQGSSQLVLSGVAAGETTVVVTAVDPHGGEASQSLAARANGAPVAAQPLPPQVVGVGGAGAPLDLAPYFNDPDGDPLSYAAESSDPGVVSAMVAAGGSGLVLTGVAAGEAVVVVTASDPYGGSASQTMTVRTNGAPTVVRALPPQVVGIGGVSAPLDLAPYFADPDGDPLTYGAESSDPGVVSAALAAGGSRLVLTGVVAGEAVITVTASDPHGGAASQTMTARANSAPLAVQALPPLVLTVGGVSEPLDLAAYFDDPDGDPLAYAAESANPRVATAGVAGALFTVTGVAAGAAVTTVTARDPYDAAASQSVTVTVKVADTAWVRAWMARFGSTVSGHVLDGVQERLRGARQAGFEATLAGRRVGGAAEEAAMQPDGGALGGAAALRHELGALAGWADERLDDPAGGGAAQRALTGRDLLASTAFTLTGGSAESGFGAVWGRGVVSRFAGRDGAWSLDGEVSTGMLGADWVSGRWITGLTLALSRGSGGYRAADSSGEIASTLTGLYPWVGYHVTERLSLWTALGYGAGSLTVTPREHASTSADVSLAMVAAGARSELLELPRLGGVTLALETDTRLTRMSTGAASDLDATDATVWQVRLGLEGARSVALEGGGVLRPSVELGLRHDGGDAETGSGIELGAGLSFSGAQSGLSLDLAARGLLAHRASGLEDWGASAALTWDPTPATARGLSMSLQQTVGASSSGGVHALLSRDTLAAPAGHGGALGAGRLLARAGYGLSLGDGRFVATPQLGYGVSDGGHHDYTLGWQLGAARHHDLPLTLGLEATRRETPDAGDAEHGVMVRFRLGY